MDAGSSNSKGGENRPPRLKNAFKKSMSWLKARKGEDTKDAAASQIPESSMHSGGNGGLGPSANNDPPQQSSVITSSSRQPLISDNNRPGIQQVPQSPPLTERSDNLGSPGHSEYGNAGDQTPTIMGRFPIDEPVHEDEPLGVQDLATGVEEYDMDTGARAALRIVLEKKMAEGLSGVSLGRFIVSTYYNRDEGIGGLVTRLTVRQIPYGSIALIVLEAVSLLVTDDEVYQLNQRSSGGSRFYSRPILPPTAGASEIRHQATQEPSAREIATNASRGPGHPLNYGLPPRPPPNNWDQLHTLPPAIPPTTNTTTQGFGITAPPQPPPQPYLQPQMGYSQPPQPNTRPGPRWPGHHMPPYLPNIDMSSQYGAGSVCIAGSEGYPPHDDDDPPLLRPTTLDRIHRGYYDDNLDSGR